MVKLKQVPVFIVNLKNDIEKRDYIKSLCEKYSLNCNFINAIYGRALPDEYINSITDKNITVNLIGRELGYGELGCALSHISIYNIMIEKNIENAIILEDDVVFNNNILTLINNINSLPKNWEIILLGYYSRAYDEKISKHSFLFKKKIFNGFSIVRLIETAYGTHGYMINQKGARKLLKIMEKIVLPIDHYTGNDKYINMYAISPRVVSVNQKYKFSSNILKDRDENFAAYNNVVKIFIYKKALLNLFKKIYISLKRFKPLKKYV